MKLFVTGRKDVFDLLKENISPKDKIIWFHCASLGEFEQGLPIMEAIKGLYPNHKLLVTFFSPSGYEVKKNHPIAEVISYLPIDTFLQVKRFLGIVNPKLVLFVKYEIWPNYLNELKKRKITTLLVSGLFRKNHSFFKSYGGFMRKSLLGFNHFFVQDENSKKLLNNIHFNNVTISGDTRFDRVSHQLEQDNTLEFIENFKRDSLCIVCGSTWTEDELVLLDYINSASENVKFIIAPHKIDASKIESFRKKLIKRSVLFSDLSTSYSEKNITQFDVLIIDTIGLLTKIYSYANIAYVGGAMGNTGLHNILEPAAFGVPIVIGKNFKNFPEAIQLQKLKGLFSVKNSSDCSKILDKLTRDETFRDKSGMISGQFVKNNTGATGKIIDHIEKLNKL